MVVKIKEKMGNILLQKPTPRVILVGMVNVIPLSSQGPKGDSALFLQDAEKCSLLREEQTGILHVHFRRNL